ncbi:unnamed protein product [Periconia digitata]|uniref:Uncharacterized protein n=1 Tax=Periconia digitata TaxID=1303443 RepID=A0A9W4XQ26_9PLEO|nr:unnamed protein product [Periconia digitata]
MRSHRALVQAAVLLSTTTHPSVQRFGPAAKSNQPVCHPDPPAWEEPRHSWSPTPPTALHDSSTCQCRTPSQSLVCTACDELARQRPKPGYPYTPHPQIQRRWPYNLPAANHASNHRFRTRGLVRNLQSQMHDTGRHPPTGSSYIVVQRGDFSRCCTVCFCFHSSHLATASHTVSHGIHPYEDPSAPKQAVACCGLLWHTAQTGQRGKHGAGDRHTDPGCHLPTLAISRAPTTILNSCARIFTFQLDLLPACTIKISGCCDYAFAATQSYLHVQTHGPYPGLFCSASQQPRGPNCRTEEIPRRNRSYAIPKNQPAQAKFHSNWHSGAGAFVCQDSVRLRQHWER